MLLCPFLPSLSAYWRSSRTKPVFQGWCCKISKGSSVWARRSSSETHDVDLGAPILKTLAPWKEGYDKPRQRIKKQRYHFASKSPYSQSYSFSSSHVWMWELDHKEGWVLKNWCFQIVVLEKTLESPLDCKIKPVNPKGNKLWIFIERTGHLTLFITPWIEKPGGLQSTESQRIGQDWATKTFAFTSVWFIPVEELVSICIPQIPGRRRPHRWRKGFLCGGCCSLNNRDDAWSGYKGRMAEFQHRSSCWFGGNLEV